MKYFPMTLTLRHIADAAASAVSEGIGMARQCHFEANDATCQIAGTSSGDTIPLPGLPRDPEFDEAYLTAVESRRTPRKAEVGRHLLATTGDRCGQHGASSPPKTTEWKQLDAGPQRKRSAMAEAFLSARSPSASRRLGGEAPTADLRRRHLKALLADRSNRPHAARHLLVTIRKMIPVALDEEWIETDQSYRLN
jgi:hypothetical protein